MKRQTQNDARPLVNEPGAFSFGKPQSPEGWERERREYPYGRGNQGPGTGPSGERLI